MLCIALYCPVLQIIDHFLGSSLKDEVRPPARLPASPFVALPACPALLPLQVMKVMPVQRMTKAGQRTRMKVSACCQWEEPRPA